MMPKKLPLLAGFILFMALLPACADWSAASRKEEKLKAAANAIVANVARRDYELVTRDFDEPLREALPPVKLRELWETIVTRAGNFKGATNSQFSREKQSEQVYDVVLVRCEFERAAINTRIVFNQADQVTGLFFLPVSP